MANTIRIKRRSTGANGAPSSLAAAELAYNEVDDTLYYGKGDSGGLATSIPAIGGPGTFVTKSTTQTIDGTKNFTGTVTLGSAATATTPSTGDNSTKVATTAFVKTQNYLTANQTITLTGDVTGSGTTSIATSHANGSVTNAHLANMAANTIKGNNTAGSATPADLTVSQAKALLAITPSDVSGPDCGGIPEQPEGHEPGHTDRGH
jgi:hypothetical protein